MRSLVLASLLIACGHPGGATSVAPQGKGSAAPDGSLPTGAPLVTVGERMLYRVSLKGFELASYSLAVGDIVDLEGRKAVTVQAHAKLAGLAQWFGGKVDDRFTSWIDVETGRSLKFQVDEYSSTNPNDIEHALIDLAKRTGDTVPVMFHLNDEPPKPEPQKVTLPETWDYNMFLVMMRAWEGPSGTKTAQEVFRSRYLWNVAVTIKGREKLVTELGELPALRFDAHTFKVDRDGSKFKDTDERDFSLWISDDAGRVPLQINARTDYGDVKMEIVEYTAGNGDPLRR